jgi:hypothetical protein
MKLYCMKCLQPFEAKTNREKYCANACKQRAYRDRKRMLTGLEVLYPTCKHCNKRMYQLRAGRPKKYCSNSCRTMAYRKRAKLDEIY